MRTFSLATLCASASAVKFINMTDLYTEPTGYETATQRGNLDLDWFNLNMSDALSLSKLGWTYLSWTNGTNIPESDNMSWDDMEAQLQSGAGDYITWARDLGYTPMTWNTETPTNNETAPD